MAMLCNNNNACLQAWVGTDIIHNPGLTEGLNLSDGEGTEWLLVVPHQTNRHWMGIFSESHKCNLLNLHWWLLVSMPYMASWLPSCCHLSAIGCQWKWHWLLHRQECVHATNVAIICLVTHNIGCFTSHSTHPDVVGPFFLNVNEDKNCISPQCLLYSVHGAIWMQITRWNIYFKLPPLKPAPLWM